MIRAIGLACVAALAGCKHQPVVAEHAVYYVGSPYQAEGVWRYPAERFAGDSSGLAGVYGAGHGPLTTNGERFDQSALAAAHPTLQLPAIARVTNLDNGRQVVLRINDRGPASPARALLLTKRAAALLEVRADAVPVRVEILEAESRQVAEALNGGPRIAISAAPREAVQSTALAPPPGIGQSVPRGSQPAPSAPARELAPMTVAARLPEVVTQTPVEPFELWIDADSFSRAEFAERQRAALAGIGASVEHVRVGRQDTYRVRAGPWPGVAQADAALDQAIRAGVTDARITVE